jgi:general secretion pathway protein D
MTREQMVRLRVMPEFSVDTGRIQIVDAGVDIKNAQPIIDRRRADTTLLVRDNQTVVLGGLKRKTVNTQIDKIPVLGDIPIIGWIFKFHGESDATSELVVFLTPRIMIKPAMSPQEIQQLDVTEFPGPKPCEILLKKDKNGDAKLIK